MALSVWLARRINSLICLIAKLPINWPLCWVALGGGRHGGRAVFLAIVLINKQEIHQGLIKGRHTTEEVGGGWGERERKRETEREGVCFSGRR